MALSTRPTAPQTALAPVLVETPPAWATVVEPTAADLDAAFARFLRLDVAAGHAAHETVRSYRTQVAGWVAWCGDNAVDAARATVDDVKRYRQDLVAAAADYKPGTIANKLTVLRRFYAAQAAGLRQDNPAVGVRAPREKKAAEDFGYLSEVELTLLFRAAPSIERKSRSATAPSWPCSAWKGCALSRSSGPTPRTCSSARMAGRCCVRGKYHDRLVYLRQDVADAVTSYLRSQERAMPDRSGTPLFTAMSNRARGRRITIRGVRFVVDGYLWRADLKWPCISDHALRHTAAALAY